jgi:acyl carrier protein
MSQAEPLSFAAFADLVAELLRVDVARVTPDTYFVTDLGVDSLGMLRVLLRLEELGVPFSLEQAFRIQTVADAYRCYRQALGAG